MGCLALLQKVRFFVTTAATTSNSNTRTGLAQAAVQDAEAVSLFPAEMFETGSTFPVSPSGVASRLASLVLSRPPPAVSEASPHAVSVLARIANDDALTPKALDLPIPEGEHDRAIERVVRLAGSKIAKYASEWTVGTTKDAFEAKFEEIVWMNTVIYAVGGWAGRALGEDEKHAFNGDFFLSVLIVRLWTRITDFCSVACIS